MVACFRPDIVLYDAGVDTHMHDSLGKLNLTDGGLRRRELLVRWRAPLVEPTWADSVKLSVHAAILACFPGPHHLRRHAMLLLLCGTRVWARASTVTSTCAPPRTIPHCRQCRKSPGSV